MVLDVESDRGSKQTESSLFLLHPQIAQQPKNFEYGFCFPAIDSQQRHRRISHRAQSLSGIFGLQRPTDILKFQKRITACPLPGKGADMFSRRSRQRVQARYGEIDAVGRTTTPP